ncbi:Ser/Thr protein phosphatase family protein [Candidatus Filomicrobium marinum]|uniref:Ser/Thr protein phosphatase family protein n=2 Tax=Filomicrobium TaxID=119044 RepID=A0A0D6JKS0_9HYPH|nr:MULTISPECIES: thiosulfohydrolase SoxB [Filomicrobium]MCV0371329.1 thiosulfohydrolase SoxB [Filomicrobium sp.]CFX56852.1 Ser/Thr protein phosphatase family protein [Candidatus Filomicrobium marinum]CPR22255.1 Ser/Thr protein phosphatase family protein [Candidatus Filomicrobium marinum]SDO90617.1 sulfate thiol esterase SoxB [Filomicrobium insigne]
MISRREFLQVSVATGALLGTAGSGAWTALAARQGLMSEAELLAFPEFGNVTLVHLTDIHAQLKPIFFREPSINIGVGEAAGKPPHVTGKEFLELYKIEPGSPEAFALTYEDFAALAKTYGRMGGIDRIATVLKSIRADREGRVLFLDGGDTWQGSYTSLKTQGADMVEVMNHLEPDAMTAHWEFTFGIDRVREIVDNLPFAFLGQNIFDNEWDEPAFEAYKMFERGGSKIAVIGQAFPYLPIANPRWMFPKLSFGIREQNVQQNVDAARAAGADVVVLLSHNGFDVDRKLASRVTGIDVILTGHTHDAIPEPVIVDKTLLVASGSHGKFLSRLDLDVRDGQVKGYKYKLIPIFSDVITPDKSMTELVDKVRAPYEAELKTVVGKADTLLYRRGNFNGTFDDLICDALLSEREADIALSPGFRWGTSVLPGQDITVEDIYNATGMTYPAAYRSEMTGARLKEILEDVADNLFNPDPYYQQGGDMVRVGGMGYAIDVSQTIGNRISDMTLLKSGEPIDPQKTYIVAGWASVAEATEGPPIWDVVTSYIKRVGTVQGKPNQSVLVKA